MTAIKVLIFNRLPLHIDFTNIPDNAYVREHIEGIKNSEYKAASSAAYSLLFQMLSDHLNMTADNIVIRQNEHGKPIIVGKNVHFNISHSKNSVVCALSDSEIGVDIEYIGEIRDSVLRKCFTEKEVQRVQTKADFYKYWTLKESYLKAVGTGIDRRLDHIEFDIGDSICCFDDGSAVPYRFYSDIIGEYVLAVCARAEIDASSVEVKRITSSDQVTDNQ